MWPGIWSCGYPPIVRALAVPFHALGVALALLAWSILTAKRRSAEAALALQLFLAFAVGWLTFTALTLMAASIALGMHANPTAAVRGLEYLRMVAGIAVTAFFVRGYRHRTGLGSLPRVDEAAWAFGKLATLFVLGLRICVTLLLLVPPAAIVLLSDLLGASDKLMTEVEIIAGACGLLCVFLIWRWIVRASRRPQSAGPRPVRVGFVATLAAGAVVAQPYVAPMPSFLLLETTNIATDDCLACRVMSPTPPGSGLGHESFIGVTAPDLSGDARSALRGRGPSASAGMARVLSPILASDDADAQRNATPLLPLLGHAGGADELLERWAASAKSAMARRAAENALVCIKRSHRGLIERRVDENCELLPATTR